jgi:Flp pilus assembly protein TadG
MFALPILAKESPVLGVMRNLAKKFAAIRSDRRGTSAIEFSFFAGLLSLGLLNMTDISRYLYQRMELENATEMGAQAVWKLCDPFKGYTPATTNCPGLTTTVTNAVQTTSLGTDVSLQSGSPAEGYYCVNSSGTLQYVSAVSSKPADCSAAGMSNLQPGDYIQVTTSFAYKPLFPGVTVASTFVTPIIRTTMMRLE